MKKLNNDDIMPVLWLICWFIFACIMAAHVGAWGFFAVVVLYGARLAVKSFLLLKAVNTAKDL